MSGVADIENILETKELNKGKTLEVEYKNGNIIYYDNVFGTWGQPTKVK